MIQIDFLKFNPRLGRVRYLALSFFWNTIAGIGVSAMLLSNLSERLELLIPLGVILILTAIINGIFIQIRRLHDIDLKGWWLLLMLIPLVNLALGLFLLFAPGSPNDNRFGVPTPNPNRNDYWLMGISLIIIIGTLILFNSSIMRTAIDKMEPPVALKIKTP